MNMQVGTTQQDNLLLRHLLNTLRMHAMAAKANPPAATAINGGVALLPAMDLARIAFTSSSETMRKHAPSRTKPGPMPMTIASSPMCNSSQTIAIMSVTVADATLPSLFILRHANLAL